MRPLAFSILIEVFNQVPRAKTAKKTCVFSRTWRAAPPKAVLGMMGIREAVLAKAGDGEWRRQPF
jgi:hypothetical protein